jgi:hypothetical protein
MTFREVKKTQKAAPKTPDAFSKFPETTGKQSRKNADGRRVVVAVARCRPSTYVLLRREGPAESDRK